MSFIMTTLLSLAVFLGIAVISLIIVLLNYLLMAFVLKQVIIYDQEIIISHQKTMMTITLAMIALYLFNIDGFIAVIISYLISSILVRIANIGIPRTYEDIEKDTNE